MMQSWIGPAIIAAIISGLVSVFGWFITQRNAVAAERRARDRKVLDFLLALRAEIRAETDALAVASDPDHLARIERRYRDDNNYSVTASSLSESVIFAGLATEIHILPSQVIDSVVVYARTYRVTASFASDLRSADFKTKSAASQLEMYRDYIETRAECHALGVKAIAVLNREIGDCDRSHDREQPLGTFLRRPDKPTRSPASDPQSRRRVAPEPSSDEKTPQ